MSRNQTGGTELIPMPHPTGAAQLSLPIILYSAVGGVKSEIMKIPNPSDENPTTSERQTPGRTQHYARIARKFQFFTGGEGMSIDSLAINNYYKLKF